MQPAAASTEFHYSSCPATTHIRTTSKNVRVNTQSTLLCYNELVPQSVHVATTFTTAIDFPAVSYQRQWQTYPPSLMLFALALHISYQEKNVSTTFLLGAQWGILSSSYPKKIYTFFEQPLSWGITSSNINIALGNFQFRISLEKVLSLPSCFPPFSRPPVPHVYSLAPLTPLPLFLSHASPS